MKLFRRLASIAAVLAATTTALVVAGPPTAQAQSLCPAFGANYPITTAPLETTTGTVAPGQTVEVAGGGFAPGSEVCIEVESDPVVLATVTASAAGTIDVIVTIPAG